MCPLDSFDLLRQSTSLCTHLISIGSCSWSQPLQHTIRFIFGTSCHQKVIIIILTRQKPAYCRQGLAGGTRQLWRAVEGVEEDRFWKSDHLLWERQKDSFFFKVITFRERQIFFKRVIIFRDRQRDIFKVMILWRQTPPTLALQTDHHHHCRHWSLCSCCCAQVTLVGEVFL